MITIEEVEKLKGWISSRTTEQVAFRLAELLQFEHEARTTLRLIGIASTNRDFATTADIPKLEWALERKLS